MKQVALLTILVGILGSSGQAVAACSVSQKANMVKLGLSVADINKECASEKNTKDSQKIPQNIIINVGQTAKVEDSKPKVANSQKTTTVTESGGEKFFWDFGIVGNSIKDKNVSGAKTSSMPVIRFFSFSFFPSGLKVGSFGIGLDWNSYILNKATTRTTSYYGSYESENKLRYGTTDLTIQYVAVQVDDVLIVPYFGKGNGERTTVNLSYDYIDYINYDISKTLYGLKFIDQSVYTKGGGWYTDIGIVKYKYTDYPNAKSFGGLIASLGYMW